MSSPAAPSRLFAYGTLMMPDVLRALCGAGHAMQPATLSDYARFRVRSHVFPGIVPRAGASTEGVIIEDIDAALWRRLDAFESDLYERVAVDVKCADRTIVAACAYVVAPHQRHILSDEAWSPREFADKHLAAYMARWT